jgi:hypothetical protein
LLPPSPEKRLTQGNATSVLMALFLYPVLRPSISPY